MIMPSAGTWLSEVIKFDLELESIKHIKFENKSAYRPNQRVCKYS